MVTPLPDWTPARRLRVCIATPDIVGPIRNGGIGTAYYALALALAAADHEVTILYTLGQHCEQESIAVWQERYRQQGLRFVPAPENTAIPLYGSWAVQRSYHTYQWLKQQDFDVIHFPEWSGHGFHSLLAKRQGLHFTGAVLCVGVHSPSEWHRMGQKSLVESLDEVEVDFMERESIALADAVISPSRYMLDWLRDQGWTLPEAVWTRPNLMTLDEGGAVPEEPSPRAVNELVFFGRLERRKGLVLFCDALDRLGDGELRDFKVTFLGKAVTVNGQDSRDYLNRRASAWPWSWQVISDLDHASAMAYLRQPHRLAVMPSLVENSPYTVLECLCARIPFIASAVGGIPELIADAQRADVLFTPQPVVLAAKLRETVREGAALALPAVSPVANRLDWLQWHDAITAAAPPSPPVLMPPRVSVCLSHFNRPNFLAQALDSLRRQDYPCFEVVLVDDGSTDPVAQAYLSGLDAEFAERNWQLLRQENRYLGAARNHAVRQARGDYVLFMDDDNIAKPHEISTYVRAAQSSGADILTCFIDVFHGTGAPGSRQLPGARSLPIGGSATVGLFRNSFGDANALVRREVFHAVGGFTEDYGIGHEDWEFFARAVLKGYRLLVVPEPLFWYRLAEDSMVRTTPDYENRVRPLRPYLEAAPPVMRDLIRFAHGSSCRPTAPAVASTGPVVNASGSTEDWQAMVDEHWDSTSWRLSRPFRWLKLRWRGWPDEQRPRVASASQAAQTINALRTTSSWELTGPLRVLGRAWHRLRHGGKH